MTPPSALQKQAAIEHTEAEGPAITSPVDIRSVSLTVLTALAAIVILQLAQAVLIPIVVGVLISYALDPIVTIIVRMRIPRPLAAAILLITLTTGTVAMLYSLRHEAVAIVNELPEAARRIRQRLTERPRSDSAIEKVQKAANELSKAADAAAPDATPPGVQRVQVESPPFKLGDVLLSGSLGVATAIGEITLVLFLVYFLLATGDLYRRKLVKIAGPSLTKKKVTLQILSEIDRQIEVFLLVQVLTSAVVALATWLALHLLGMQQAAVWGIAAGVFNSIPYLGPVIVAGGTSTIAFLQFNSIQMALLIGGVTLAITSVEGFLLTPWLAGRAARMNAVAVFVNILFWGWMWGVWGMLLAVPMLMVVKAVSDHVEDFRPVGELIGD